MRTPQVIIALGLVVLVALLLAPQRHPPRYDADAEVTLHGVVNDVRDFYCPISGAVGTHLTVATQDGVVEVHVAPSRFLQGKKWEFFPGDQLDVTGSRIFYRGHEALIARAIVRGDHTVALRKVDGKPLWVN